MACVKQRSVAKVSSTLATELGTNFQDNAGNYVVSLQLAAELEHDEFTVIAADYAESDLKGILPINPKKPIVRPKV